MAVLRIESAGTYTVNMADWYAAVLSQAIVQVLQEKGCCIFRIGDSSVDYHDILIGPSTEFTVDWGDSRPEPLGDKSLSLVSKVIELESKTHIVEMWNQEDLQEVIDV